MNVFFAYCIAYIKASAHAARIAFTPDIITFFIFFIFIQSLCSRKYQITIFQLYLNFIFLKSRKIYIQFIAFSMVGSFRFVTR